MNKIFLTADMHFGHTNIIKYENRPFMGADDMDDAIIKKWNKVVSKSDTVIVAGDVSFYKKEKTAEIVQNLNGKKILIKGNHDQRNNAWWAEAGFDEVSSYPIIYKEWFVIQHEPPYYYNDATPYFYIYGHVHGSEMYKTITKQTACVCVERWDYAPVELEKIIELAKLV
jgi:calcineurin-like phosphoesterase family protein